MKLNSSRRAGKSLIELLVVIAAISAILATAGRLVFQLSRAERAARDGTAVGRAEVRLARDLRSDARGAFSAELVGPGNGLRLKTPGGTIDYTLDDIGLLRTAAGDRARRDAYRLGPVEAAFAVEGRTVTLDVRPRPVEPHAARAAAGPLQIVAAVGADRLGGESPRGEAAGPVEASRRANGPVEAPRPKEGSP